MESGIDRCRCTARRVDSRAAAIVAELGISDDVRLAEELVSEALGLITDQPDTLNLKIADRGTRRDARCVRDVRAVPRSAEGLDLRIGPDPDGRSALRPGATARRGARRARLDDGHRSRSGNHAGRDGGRRERQKSIGVSIRLPFESGANSVIAGDAKHVSMKYFFTRKLMLIKESQAFVCLPGGFGTLDETFELLTLTQTGKGMPVPIVLLDAPGDPYWESIDTFVRDTLIARGLVAAHDTALYTITDSCETAAAVIERFYSNYHSIRFVGDNLVIRMRRARTHEQLADVERTVRPPRRQGDDRGGRAVQGGTSRRRSRRPRPDRVQLLQARLQRADQHDRRDQRLLSDQRQV